MCDDLTNNDACDYDGGDCCGDSVNEQYCNECICHETGDTANTNNCPTEHAMWVGDTFCDDSTNIEGILIVKETVQKNILYLFQLFLHVSKSNVRM